MNFKQHRAIMQHAARYVKQCTARLRYAELHERSDAEIAMHAANLQRAEEAQHQRRAIKLSTLTK